MGGVSLSAMRVKGMAFEGGVEEVLFEFMESFFDDGFQMAVTFDKLAFGTVELTRADELEVGLEFLNGDIHSRFPHKKYDTSNTST